ncbi:hypothetical protein Pmani_036465 [Petrolisthes manimaculis]|uniref:Uncharacterized protein n=1 Tax=Petrolisthes manimaculis TaxID=1843537 RepID=A0AAE1NIE5_9EUCA|nr:hypothetical protein Pmani_036465 [Petrolisthes manimaculis]
MHKRRSFGLCFDAERGFWGSNTLLSHCPPGRLREFLQAVRYQPPLSSVHDPCLYPRPLSRPQRPMHVLPTTTAHAAHNDPYTPPTTTPDHSS